MTFKQIVDAVLRNRFDETERGQAKDWVNFRLGWFWNLEEWTFQFGTDDVAVTAGSQLVTSVPADLGAALALLKSNGEPLEPVRDTRVFFARYYDHEAAISGVPEAFTLVGMGSDDPQLLVGPTSTETRTDYKLIYEKRVTLLTGDNDVPNIPEELHFGLVHGGRSEGMKLQNDPTWQSVEKDFLDTISTARRRYLSSIRGTSAQFGDGRARQW